MAKRVRAEKHRVNECTQRCAGILDTDGRRQGRRDISDLSDQRGAARVLTLQEALVEINYQGSGPAKNAELYRSGDLSEDKAVECVVYAIPLRSEKGPEPESPG